MAYSFENKRDEPYMDGPLSGATTQLLRVAGGWGNISGPSVFMLRSLVAGSTSAIAFGLTGSTLTAIIYKTAAIPFVVSSCIGFIIGVVGFYKDCVAKAMLNLDLYPRLLQLHLDSNFPWKGFRSWQLNDFRSVHFSGSWTLKSMLLVSWLTAQPALDKITEAKEQAIVDRAIELIQNGGQREKVEGESDQ